MLITERLAFFTSTVLNATKKKVLTNCENIYRLRPLVYIGGGGGGGGGRYERNDRYEKGENTLAE